MATRQQRQELINPILRWGRIELGIPSSQAAFSPANAAALDHRIVQGGVRGFTQELVHRALTTRFEECPDPVVVHRNFPGNIDDLSEAQLDKALFVSRPGMRLVQVDPSDSPPESLSVVGCEIVTPSGDFDDLTAPPPEGSRGRRRPFKADLILKVGTSRLVHCELKKARSLEPPSQAAFQALMYWSQLAGHHGARVGEKVTGERDRSIDRAEVWIAAPTSYYVRHFRSDGAAIAALRILATWTNPRIIFMGINAGKDGTVDFRPIAYP